MTRHSFILTAATVLVLGATPSSGFAQGYGDASGSAGSAASALGFTASPPVARGGNPPVVTAPVSDPVVTGSIARRDRGRTRWQRR